MTLFLSICLSGLLWLGALPGFGALFSGTQPDNLGVQNQQFAPCPDSPNCVSSQTIAGDNLHHIAPITYTGDRQTAKALIHRILGAVPRTTIVVETEDYIRAESRSKLMGFVDDVEFYFPAEQNQIEIRSASRLGESDLGVNRRRLEQIRLAFLELSQSA